MREKEKRISKVLSEPARIRLGKSGINEGVLNEIKRHLEEEKIVKIKVLKSLIKMGYEVDQIAEKVASALNAEIVDIRGHTFTLKSKSARKS